MVVFLIIFQYFYEHTLKCHFSPNTRTKMSFQIASSNTQQKHQKKMEWRTNVFGFVVLTLQSNANLLASIMAAFLSLSDSNANTKESPIFGCQNSAWAAAFPPPLTPQSWKIRKTMTQLSQKHGSSLFLTDKRPHQEIKTKD